MKGIFIGATGQHVGKTTSCLGIMQGLRRHFKKVGFMKPVGQQTVKTSSGHVDKDIGLFKNKFEIFGSLNEMSPVVFPPGFTRNYLDNKISLEELEARITGAYASLSAQHDFMLVEGTGHTGVGALCDLDNAKVASLLGLSVVLITNGGLGKAYDSFILNKALYDLAGVPVKGVILNRVLDSKREMIKGYFEIALNKLKIPLIGLIPHNPLLEKPTVQDFVNLFHTKLISGHEHLLWHFEHVRLVATTLEHYREGLIPNQLVITPSLREDIIFAKLDQHQSTHIDSDQGIFGGGLVLTGEDPPSERILNALKSSSLPAIYANMSAYKALEKITHFTAKIRAEDDFKISKAIHHVEPNIDFDQLLSS